MLAKVLPLIAALALFSVACSKTTSDNVKTSGVYATYTVQAHGSDRVDCSVRFQVGGGTGTSLELTGSDQVTCEGQPMTKSEAFGIVTYSASLPYIPNYNYRVEFTRPQEPVYTAQVSLPEPILNVSPSAPVTLKKGTPLTVTWTPSLDPQAEMTAYLQYATGESTHGRYRSDSAPENGVLEFNGEATSLTPNVLGNWSGTLRITRRRQGQMPMGLAGAISGEQSRVVDVTLVD